MLFTGLTCQVTPSIESQLHERRWCSSHRPSRLDGAKLICLGLNMQIEANVPLILYHASNAMMPQVFRLPFLIVLSLSFFQTLKSYVFIPKTRSLLVARTPMPPVRLCFLPTRSNSSKILTMMHSERPIHCAEASRYGRDEPRHQHPCSIKIRDFFGFSLNRLGLALPGPRGSACGGAFGLRSGFGLANENVGPAGSSHFSSTSTRCRLLAIPTHTHMSAKGRSNR